MPCNIDGGIEIAVSRDLCGVAVPRPPPWPHLRRHHWRGRPGSSAPDRLSPRTHTETTTPTFGRRGLMLSLWAAEVSSARQPSIRRRRNSTARSGTAVLRKAVRTLQSRVALHRSAESLAWAWRGKWRALWVGGLPRESVVCYHRACVGDSSSGRTADSGSASSGSNPGSPASPLWRIRLVAKDTALSRRRPRVRIPYALLSPPPLA